MEGTQETPSEIFTIAFHHRAIVASVLIVLAMIGLFGNTLVIVSVIVTRKLRTITNILVVNLAFADFLSCVCLPFLSIGFLSRAGKYPLHDSVCATVAGLLHTCICCSASTLLAIAFVRWYVITRSIRGHQGIHTPRKIAAVALFIWTESTAFMVLPPVLGIGRLGYSTYYGMCAFIGTTKAALYYVTSQGIFTGALLVLSLTFYCLILFHVLQHNRQFRDKFAVAEDNPSSTKEAHQTKASSSVSKDSRTPMIKAINQKEIEITKNVFTVACLFIICYTASSVNFIIPGSSLSTLYGYMVMLTNSVVNPIIYGLKHPNFQEAFKRILCCRREQLEHLSY